jgi:LysM repeat protein
LVLGSKEFDLELDFDAPEITESSLACTFTSVDLSADGSELELVLVLKAIATGYREESAEYITSLTGADSQQRTVQLRNRIGEGEYKVTLDGSCPFASIPQAIDLVLPQVRILESQALESKILVRGLLTLDVYYFDDSGQRRVLVQEEEFSQFFDFEGSGKGYSVKSWAWPEGGNCADGHYTVPVRIRAEVVEEAEFRAVTDVHVVDPFQVPANASVILYAAKTGDSMFSVARKFNTTQELLCKYNGLSEQDCLRPGQKILIPVYQTRF